MRFTSLMKPMSSMRSASSRTSQRVCERSTRPSRIRSVKRPGVAIRTSMPGAIRLICDSLETPPRTSAVEICACLETLRIVCSICTASSRVGARIRARAVFGRRLSPRPMIFCRIGKLKAAVLPEPVCAMPRISRPSLMRDRLQLDRLRLGHASGFDALEQNAGNAKSGKTARNFFCQFNLFGGTMMSWAASKCRSSATCRTLSVQ